MLHNMLTGVCAISAKLSLTNLENFLASNKKSTSYAEHCTVIHRESLWQHGNKPRLLRQGP